MSFEEILRSVAVEHGFSGALLEEFMEHFDISGWRRVANKAYPPQYAFSQGRYSANPEAVRRMRQAISTVPRVNPEEYDILMNLEGSDIRFDGPTWDIVKWMRWPEVSGRIPGVGGITTIVLEPYPVYHIPAWREPLSLSDVDWMRMFHNSTTLRGGQAISREVADRNEARKASQKRSQENEDLGLAEYARDHVKDIADSKGI